MKKLVLVGLLFLGLNCLGQETGKWIGKSNVDLPSTNQKEYNYLTKGLKIERESGLDIIDGYRLIEGGKSVIGEYDFNFSNLVEISTQNLKGISVVINSRSTKNTYYLCIPVNNTDLLNQYVAYTYQFTPALAMAYSTALASKYSQYLQLMSERSKK